MRLSYDASIFVPFSLCYTSRYSNSVITFASSSLNSIFLSSPHQLSSISTLPTYSHLSTLKPNASWT